MEWYIELIFKETVTLCVIGVVFFSGMLFAYYDVFELKFKILKKIAKKEFLEKQGIQ